MKNSKKEPSAKFNPLRRKTCPVQNSKTWRVSTKKKKDFNSPAELRFLAEHRLRKRRPEGGQNEADTQRLLHELQVHQIELEMQNEELQNTKSALEAGLEKYSDLYDFAPVGYFSINEEGTIREVNLAGAAMLGMERTDLINCHLPRFLALASRPAWLAFLARVLAGTEKQVCQLSLLKRNGTTFWADLQATPIQLGPGALRPGCRLTVSDLSAVKRAEDAQKRMEDLGAANQELQREIIRRQKVETALKKSEEQQRRLLEESHHMQEQLRHLSHQVLQAQEEERKRISRDLHDQVTQTLVGINVHLTALTQQAEVNIKGLRQKIARTQRLVEESVSVVHRFARELRPTLLDDLGLVSALHSHLKDFTKRTGIHIRFTTFTSGRIPELDSAESTVLYRVALEALTNVARHARASHVNITLQKLPGAIQLEITDDGVGFGEKRALLRAREGRLGMLGMKERLQMVGGFCAVETCPGSGTIIRARIPLRGGRRSRTKARLA